MGSLFVRGLDVTKRHCERISSVVSSLAMGESFSILVARSGVQALGCSRSIFCLFLPLSKTSGALLSSCFFRSISMIGLRVEFLKGSSIDSF